MRAIPAALGLCPTGLLSAVLEWGCVSRPLAPAGGQRPIGWQRAGPWAVWTAPAPASWREPATYLWGGRVQSGHWHFDLVLVVTTSKIAFKFL